MKTLKKILCTLLVVVMCLTSAPLQGFVGIKWPDINIVEWFGIRASAVKELATTGRYSGDVYWNYDRATGELVISGVGPMMDWSSASTQQPFYDSDIKSVIIEEGVITIGDSAFIDCKNLSDVKIGNSVTYIGHDSFVGCENLKNVTLGTNVTTIGFQAFNGCGNLKNIFLPESIVEIGSYAFCGCSSLESVKIPDSLMVVRDGCFKNCTNLTSVIFGNSINSIGAGAFGGCYSLSYVVVPNSVTKIDYSFVGCDNLLNVYFGGSKDEWKKISDNAGISKDTTIYYNSTGPDDPNNDQNNDSSNNTSGKEEKERDFSDYKVFSGKLDEIIYGVDSDGGQSITEIIFKGKRYKIAGNCTIYAPYQFTIDKEFVFSILNDEIVMIEPLERVSDYCLTTQITDDLRLGCGCGYMWSGQDSSFDGFKEDKELKLNTYALPNREHMVVRGLDFDDELLEYILSKTPETQLHIDKIQIKLRDTKAISFDGKDTYTINVNADIKSNQTLVNSVPIKIKRDYKIPADVKSEMVLFDIIITGIRNGEKVEFTSTDKIIIRNSDYVEPVKDKNNKPTNKQYAKDAAAKLDNLTGAITLTGLWELFSSEELDYIGNVILAEIAMAEAPKDTLKQYLSTKVIDSLFNIDSNFIKVGEDTIEFAVAGDTKYGEIKLKLICKYSKVYFSGSEFCFTGSVDYEIVGGDGASKLPSSYKNGGLAGMFSSVDMQSFCESAYKLFECHFQKGVDKVWGNDVDGAADLIFGTIVNEILAETELKSVSNIAFELIAKPGKSVLINCPVDVYVYNADNELVAAVVGNEVIKTDEKAKISVDGDVKEVILLDDSYNIVYKAMADGEMKVTVEEYGTSGGLLNSSTISRIPLIAGRKYTQSIDDSFMEDSDYMIVSASGNEYAPDKEYSTLAGHDYVSGIIKEVTCQENGYMIHTCSKCGDAFTETIQSNGHNFTEGESKCSNCDFDRADNCGCKCHNTGFFAKLIWKITIFFNKLLRKNKVCSCGIYHY